MGRFEYFTKLKIGLRGETDVIGRATPSTAIGAAVGLAVAAMKLSKREGRDLGACAAALVAEAGPEASYPLRKTVGVAWIEIGVRALKGTDHG